MTKNATNDEIDEDAFEEIKNLCYLKYLAKQDELLAEVLWGKEHWAKRWVRRCIGWLKRLTEGGAGNGRWTKRGAKRILRRLKKLERDSLGRV